MIIPLCLRPLKGGIIPLVSSWETISSSSLARSFASHSVPRLAPQKAHWNKVYIDNINKLRNEDKAEPYAAATIRGRVATTSWAAMPKEQRSNRDNSIYFIILFGFIYIDIVVQVPVNIKIRRPRAVSCCHRHIPCHQRRWKHFLLLLSSYRLCSCHRLLWYNCHLSGNLPVWCIPLLVYYYSPANLLHFV